MKRLSVWFALALFLSAAPVLAQRLPYIGQTIVVVTLSGSTIGGPVQAYREQWELQTGGFVELVRFAFEPLYGSIMRALTEGTGEYDVLIYASGWSGDIMGGGYVLPIPDEIKTRIDWEDILPLYRERIADWGGVTYALPFDGDSHMMYYRSDLIGPETPYAAEFERRFGYPLDVPQTWDQYRDVASFFQGRTVNTSGINAPIFGVIEAQRPNAQSYWFLMSRAAGYAKVPGDPCFLFDCQDETPMRPRINNPGWVRALDDWVAIREFGMPDMLNVDVAQVRSRFPTGLAALALDWGDVGPLTVDPNISAVNGLSGYSVLPGGSEYWDPALGAWVTPESGVNRAPFIAFGGWVISVAADSDVAEAAMDFAAFMASKELAATLATTAGTGINPLRASQFENLDLWIEAGFSEDAARQYLGAIRETIEHPNAVLDLRIPGAADYFQALDAQIYRALTGELSAQEALDRAAQAWEAITDRYGRDEQLALYRASLGLE